MFELVAGDGTGVHLDEGLEDVVAKRVLGIGEDEGGEGNVV